MTKTDRVSLIREYHEAKDAYVRCMKKDQIARAQAHMNVMCDIADKLDAETKDDNQDG